MRGQPETETLLMWGKNPQWHDDDMDHWSIHLHWHWHDLEYGQPLTTDWQGRGGEVVRCDAACMIEKNYNDWALFVCIIQFPARNNDSDVARHLDYTNYQSFKMSKFQNFKVLTLTSNKYLHILLLVYILTKTIDVHNSFEFPRYEQSHQVNAVQFASSRCLHDPERHCG